MFNAALFGMKHLTGTTIVTLGIIVGAILFYRQGEVSYKKQKQLIIHFSIFFVVLESLNLIMITLNDGQFPLYQLPFHLCSMPLYTYPLLSFSKENSTLRKIISPAAFAVLFGAGVVTLALPTNVLGGAPRWLPLSDNILPLISFTYHGLMVLSSFMLVFTGYYKPKYRDVFWAVLITLVLAGFATIANMNLGTDYMLINVGNGSPLQFLYAINPWLYRVSMIGLAISLLTVIMSTASLLTRPKPVTVTEKVYKTS